MLFLHVGIHLHYQQQAAEMLLPETLSVLLPETTKLLLQETVNLLLLQLELCLVEVILLKTVRCADIKNTGVQTGNSVLNVMTASC